MDRDFTMGRAIRLDSSLMLTPTIIREANLSTSDTVVVTTFDGGFIVRKVTPTHTSTMSEEWAKKIISLYSKRIINIIGNGKKTDVVMYNGATGQSICMEGDTFNFNIGLAIAIARALNLQIPREVLGKK